MCPFFPISNFRSRRACFSGSFRKLTNFPDTFWEVRSGKIRLEFSLGKVSGKLVNFRNPVFEALPFPVPAASENCPNLFFLPRSGRSPPSPPHPSMPSAAVAATWHTPPRRCPRLWKVRVDGGGCTLQDHAQEGEVSLQSLSLLLP
jgi:hypothetical protein